MRRAPNNEFQIERMNKASTSVQAVDAEQVLALRTLFREECNCQIVHDSLHRRPGWTLTFLFQVDGLDAGFGSIAVAGPWLGKPTIYEFFVVPEFRGLCFDLFEAFLRRSGAQLFEVQTSETHLNVMLHAYGVDIESEKIVFQDRISTRLTVSDAALKPVTPRSEILQAMERRQGGGEWVLEVGGMAVGKGGLLFHYNQPYGDVYMEISEPFRRKGYGSFLVQELKRECRNLGAIPCARCNCSNVASRRTLQRAGFVPSSHILLGRLREDQQA